MATEGQIRRTIQQTVTTKNATLATAASTQDAACTTAMNAIITAQTPPAGYVTNSVQLGPTSSYFDGTDYVFVNSITYNTVNAS